jgi:hypothetical protein
MNLLPLGCLLRLPQVAIFEGTCYTTPILGALLADSRWGRYKTILVSHPSLLTLNICCSVCVARCCGGTILVKTLH